MPADAAPRATAPFVPQSPVERDTIPRIFYATVDRAPDQPALMHKAGDAWRSLSRREVAERVEALAAAMAQEGIAPGDRIAILSENRPEWAITDYAATAMGVVDVPVYPTLPANQIEYILRDSGARAVFASTAEQLAKIEEIRGALPELSLLVSFDAAGGGAGVRHFDDLLAAGRTAIEAGGVPSLRERALKVDRDEMATLIYTSGTTGDPKGVMLTHYNLASNVAAVLQHPLGGVIREGDTALSFLPLSHVFERMVDYLYWEVGATIAYAESIDRVADNLVEVRPEVAVSVPRLFDKIYGRVVGATGIKKVLVMWAKGVGEAVADLRFAGREPSGWLAMRHRLADRLVFSKLRARTGGRLRNFVSGGAPLSAEVARFFFAAGLPVYEGYGLTETSPVIAVNKPGATRLGTVGKPLPGVEVALAAETGEILTRGPHVMKGYWNAPEATAAVVDAEGWFHTGDVGAISADGFLSITDRLKDIIVTAGGKNVAPQPVENAAAMSPFATQVVMIGDRRPFPSLLVVPDFENLIPWATENGIPTSDRAALVADPRVVRHLEAEILGRLEGFANYERPKKVAVIAEEFTIDAGLLTPKLSVKRRAVEARHRETIEGMYSG